MSLSGWNPNNIINITIPDQGEDLVNFPLTINLSDSSGTNSFDLTGIFNELGTNSKKIAIEYLPTGEQCYTEIEFWDNINKKAVLHTKVPKVIAGTETKLRLYYDNTQADNTTYIGDTGDVAAQNVWDSNYIAVYHMAQDPSGTAPQILDSTSGANNGTTYGSMTSSDLVEGLTSKALDFDGNDYISITQNSSFDLQTLQIEALYNPRGFGGGAGLPTILGRWGSTNSFFFSIDDGDLYSAGTIRLNTTNQIIYSDTTLSTGQYYHLVGSYGGGVYKIHIDGAVEKTVNQTDTVATGSSELLVGALNNLNTTNNLNGVLQELRVSDTIRSDKWVSTTNKSIRDNLLSFSIITFYYTNIYPNNTTVYGLQQQLQSTITISGINNNYIYDATFYLNQDSVIDTISGANSGDTVHVSLDTLAGGTYSWYIETTTSGITDISPTYSFEVRYLCSGICSDGSNTLSGIKIMLHKRDTGELVGYDLSDAEGRFSIETIHNADHYAVALHNSNNYNALVYDRLKP